VLIDPIKDWLDDNGLILIKFPIVAEYTILNQIMNVINDQNFIIIHSKLLRYTFVSDNAIKIDATGHALTAHTALRQKISTSDDISALDNLEDIQSILNQFHKIRKSHPLPRWWIWCSPSDLVAHDISEDEILRCLRAIAKEYSDIRFIALVAKEVHSERALSRFEYIADILLDVETHREEEAYQWQISKHPGIEKKGVQFNA